MAFLQTYSIVLTVFIFIVFYFRKDLIQAIINNYLKKVDAKIPTSVGLVKFEITQILNESLYFTDEVLKSIEDAKDYLTNSELLDPAMKRNMIIVQNIQEYLQRHLKHSGEDMAGRAIYILPEDDKGEITRLVQQIH
ncbi:hypothetical protein [Deinococcus sp. AJ005]|uniref:hypothetical protein n=1 Tax=Deinococcus sp. AJ005 TaxID=2652443 RepID=UPI00125CCA55|nr:hypothetical protein [Deinococcus sp. AJ005]QFP77955.1 hypothetical protein DAAJ005_17005 [Deinococcus sp. AJ005]